MSNSVSTKQFNSRKHLNLLLTLHGRGNNCSLPRLVGVSLGESPEIPTSGVSPFQAHRMTSVCLLWRGDPGSTSLVSVIQRSGSSDYSCRSHTLVPLVFGVFWHLSVVFRPVSLPVPSPSFPLRHFFVGLRRSSTSQNSRERTVLATHSIFGSEVPVTLVKGLGRRNTWNPYDESGTRTEE